MNKQNHKIRAALVSIGALVFSATAFAQSNLSESQVDGVFTPWNVPNSPGCACGVYKGGNVVYAKGFGSADLEHKAPLTPDSVFYIASTSKQFTAAAIALLVIDGKLSLEDDFRKHFPEFKNLPAGVTVGQLVYHTSGIRDYLELLTMTGRAESARLNNDFVVKFLSRQKALNFEPGTQHLYSNSNYVLLAELVRRVSGRSLPEFARERIFTPLGMKDTRFGDNASEIVPDRVMSYGTTPGGQFQFIKTIESYGDGNVLTTVNDLARWDENFYTGKVGGPKFLQLQNSVGFLKNGKKIDYGFGLGHEEFRGQALISHSGGYQGFRTELIRFPAQHVSVAVLCNSATINAAALARRVAYIQLADVFGPLPASTPAIGATPTPAPIDRTAITIDPSILNRYVGNYALNEQLQFVMSFTREGDAFFIQPTGQMKVQLYPESETKFFSKMIDAQVTFHVEPDGSVNRITLHQRGEHDAKRVNADSMPVSALNEFAGKYYSDELDITYQFAIQDGFLALLNPDGQPFRLRTSHRDQFQLGQGQLTFHRNPSGRIDAMNYSGMRVKNVMFSRQAMNVK